MNRKLWSALVVVIIGGTAGGIAAWKITLLPPMCADACPLTGERLSVGGYHVNSPTNVTVRLANVGTLDILLASYSINDSSGHQYLSSNWPGLTLARGSSVTTSLVIDGTTFTFQQGSVYTITMVSSDNVKWPNYFGA